MRGSSPMFSSSRHARRGLTRRRLMLYLGAGIAAILALGLLVGAVLWWYAGSKIDEVDIPALNENRAEDAEFTDEIEGTLNVLVVGNATREGLTEEQLLELGTEDDGSALTDTIMLVQISPVRDEAVVVSFPRDLQVDIPGHDDVKINSVQSRAGADGLVREVQDLTGVPIDHYVQIDMAGFLRLANALGGVEVCLDEALVDAHAGVDLPSGCTVLDGAEALGFVRSRRVATEQFGADDFGRIAKQQYYIQQAMGQVTSTGTLLNPLRVKSLIDAVAGSVTTDRALGLRDLYRIANTLKALDPDDVMLRTVPGYSDGGFVIMEVEAAETLFQGLRDGSDLDDVGTEAPDELGPADVRVLIVNGVGIEGLAADVQSYLEDREFVVTDAVNPSDLDPDTEFDTTLQGLTIRHTAARLRHAEILRDRLGDVPVELDEVDPGELPDGADVLLEVGAAWNDQG